MRFSANIGFLWTDRALPDRILAAKAAGFDAVECHFPYDTDPTDIAAALDETGLPMLCLNTRPGDLDAGDFGLAALPGRKREAEETIREAIEYAGKVGARAVHVMAGKGLGDPASADTFLDNLSFAIRASEEQRLVILIEPINTRDVPGYTLNSLEAAAGIFSIFKHPRLRIMFDCYHMQIMGGDLLNRYRANDRAIAHIQFASVPDRSEPIDGEVDYSWLLPSLERAGYDGFFGAEYRPRAGVEEGLGWMDAFRS